MYHINAFQTEEDTRTQCEIVKSHLKAGNTLSTFDAYRLFNITCLAQRVHDLRHKQGLIIDSNPVIYNGKRFVVYSWNPANDLTETAPAFEHTPQEDQEATATAPVMEG